MVLYYHSGLYFGNVVSLLSRVKQMGIVAPLYHWDKAEVYRVHQYHRSIPV